MGKPFKCLDHLLLLFSFMKRVLGLFFSFLNISVNITKSSSATWKAHKLKFPIRVEKKNGKLQIHKLFSWI